MTNTKNKITPHTIARQLFAFLSSLQLAVVLLVALAAILAVGTFIESSQDAAAAKYYVYNTWWFAAFLGVLGLNVLFAALSRYPWKRHHTGFLIVHLGILIILAGSLMSVFGGVEGQLIIPEGETRHRIFLTQERLYFFEGETGKLEEMPADFRFDPPTKEEPYGGKVLGGHLVRVIDYLPNAQMEIKVTEGEGEPNPALQVELKGSRAELKEWLFAQDYEKRRADLGPASLTFLELPQQSDLAQLTQHTEMRGPYLWVEGEWVPVTGNLGKEIFLKNGKKLFIQNLLPEAVVSQGVLVNRSEQPLNPAVLVTLSQPSEGDLPCPACRQAGGRQAAGRRQAGGGTEFQKKSGEKSGDGGKYCTEKCGDGAPRVCPLFLLAHGHKPSWLRGSGVHR